MTFGPQGSGGARVYDPKTVGDILDLHKKFGHDELDTARGYCNGEEEAFITKVGWKERGLKLASKCYPSEPGGHSTKKLRETLEYSLSQLKTDKIDLYYLHAPDWDTPFEETVKAMDDLYKEGRVAEWGVSNFTVSIYLFVFILIAGVASCGDV